MATGQGDLNEIVDLLAAILEPCAAGGITVCPRGYNAGVCLPVINIRPIEGNREDRGRCQAQFVITAYADICKDAWSTIYTLMSPCTNGSIIQCLKAGKQTLLDAGYEYKFDSPRNFSNAPWNDDKANAYAAQVVVTVYYCCCKDNCFEGE